MYAGQEEKNLYINGPLRAAVMFQADSDLPDSDIPAFCAGIPAQQMPL